MMVAVLSAVAVLLLPEPAHAQNPGRFEIGIVYYSDGAEFKPIAMELAPESGRANFAARVKGPHATLRLSTGEVHTFRICGVDPSRYKLFTFKSDGKSRMVTVSKVNIWIGGAKSVLSESEIPLRIESAESNCFSLTPKDILKEGEYGFSPAGAEDAFMFGIGDVKTTK